MNIMNNGATVEILSVKTRELQNKNHLVTIRCRYKHHETALNYLVHDRFEIKRAERMNEENRQTHIIMVVKQKFFNSLYEFIDIINEQLRPSPN